MERVIYMERVNNRMEMENFQLNDTTKYQFCFIITNTLLKRELKRGSKRKFSNQYTFFPQVWIRTVMQSENTLFLFGHHLNKEQYTMPRKF